VFSEQINDFGVCEENITTIKITFERCGKAVCGNSCEVSSQK